MKKFDIAVVGCTGKVGRQMITVLEERKLPYNNVVMFASAKSAGSTIKFDGKDYTIVELSEENIKANKVDIVLMSAGGGTSKTFAPIFAETGAIVIDNSSQWRMDENVPLVVPEANAQDAINPPKGIIANPNCSTIQAIVALKPLNDKYGIERIVYSTYQAVSGAGVAGSQDLVNGEQGIAPKKFNQPIYHNLIPQIDVFDPNGYTKEELKMVNETRKIFHNPEMRVTATTVRVPVPNCHSESINVELKKPFDIEELKQDLANAEGLVLVDDIANCVYPMPCNCDNKDEVFVGRVRRDFSVENGINLWCVADNIRKGAATNAVQIAQYLIANWNK
ncbi:MAG: aspartate-semialdehyde dehydrogenase [Clostridiales bacterium]|nr:aspartate-semialdehyde dehydrogenase [Clostridiales bacterium]